MFQANLISKRDKLSDQLSEALKLKTSIDKRAETVSRMLEGYLGSDDDEPSFADYQAFIRSKAALIVEAREAADRTAAAEEQLQALKETM